jgi:prepilin-type N-terminal cleavage/methylation domain-containing protein
LPLAGFTLLELMVVLGIMGLMAWLTIPALSSLKSSGGLNASAAAVQSILTQARAQAMLSDSHVFVGFYESDASQADTVRPAPTGVGRLWIGVALTKDGTQGYDLTNAASWSASNLTPVGKLRFFDNLHLATNATFYLSSGTSNTVSPVGDPSVTNTPFGWPLENSNSVTQFISGVIQFTPQGAAMLPGSTIPEYIQLALIPTHGTLIASNLPNAAVIQVDAITGAMRTFRP